MSTPDDQRKRPTDAGGEPPLKRRLVSEHDRFFAGLPDGQLCSEQKVLKFPERIADGDIKTIFQRECFGPLKDKVEKVVSEKEGDRSKWSSVIITGSSGIGKTLFGFYLAHQLVQAGKTVAYNYRNQLRVVLAPSVSELQSSKRRFPLDLLRQYQKGQLSPMEGKEETDDQRDASRYWGAVDKTSDFWKKLLQNEETWLLVDLHRGDTYEDGRQRCKIVLTSTLRQGDWPDLDSGGGSISRKLYMGPLSFEEAKEIKSTLNLPISDEEITRRYAEFGGSARFLFHAGAEQKVNEAFQKGVQASLDPNTENPVRASALVHIIADENFEYVGRKWASQKIAERAVDALIDSREAGEQVWLEATQGRAGKHIMGARGIFAERLWHRQVQSDKEIRLKRLKPSPEGKTIAVEMKKLVKSFHHTRRFSKADLSDLTQMDVGDYILPDNDQFPDVDAIAVLNHDPWVPIADEESSFEADEESSPEADQKVSTNCIGIMLQMAIGSSHKRPQGQTLLDIDNKMGALVEGYTAGLSALYLIYVTESADSWSQLTYTTKEGKSYATGKMPRRLGQIEQFAMSFPKLSDTSASVL